MQTSPGVDWRGLSHAYGTAADLPQLLARAATDLRPGGARESAWFDLWSALCHQGDAYSASYAAAPALVQIAADRAGTPQQYDPICLVACIELARLEGRGPAIPVALAPSYRASITLAERLTTEALLRPWPADFREELEGCLAALRGDAPTARAIFDADLLSEGE